MQQCNINIKNYTYYYNFDFINKKICSGLINYFLLFKTQFDFKTKCLQDVYIIHINVFFIFHTQWCII